LISTSIAFAGWSDAIFPAHDEDGSTAVQDILTSMEPADSADAREHLVKGALSAFYGSRDFRLVWSGDDDAEENASTVKLALEHADRQGLAGSDYMSALAPWSDAPASGGDAAKYDVALTEALFRYAFDVRLGRTVPKTIYKDVALPQQSFDVAAQLSTAIRRRQIVEFLAELPPPHPGYRWLVDALARYRAIAKQGGWTAVPSGSAIAVAGKDGKPTALARRLALEDPALAGNPDPSDDELREALLRFQRRNGLEDNGKLDPDTLKALNAPVSTRLGEILANMERWRWMPRAFERRYILVNVPDQSLELVAGQEARLSSKVIIGKKTSPTPIMRTAVEAVITNPPWDVPDDIAAKKLLPHLRHDPNYLASRNMIFAGGQFQQNPGEGNVLGKLMLDSPNPFDVYMHDTPEKQLFLSNMREKSNGCIRVEQIAPLASLALATDNADDMLNDAIATGETQRLPLSQPLAVYMVYWTAFADADGAMEFRPDRYGRDPPLLAKLPNAPQIRLGPNRTVAANRPSRAGKRR
jgi:murein L,D-transpeptidase YcbB/YkuD